MEKNILFILTSPDIYGAEKSILTNIDYLKNNDYINPIFIIRTSGSLKDYLVKKKLQFYIVPFCYWVSLKKHNFFKSLVKFLINVFFSFYLLMVLKKYKIQYIYTNTFSTHIGLILSYISKIKHVFHIREISEKSLKYNFDLEKKKIMRYADKFSANIFVNSKYLKNHYKKFFKKNKIKVVSNPIENHFIHKNKYNFKNKVKILFYGRLNEDKHPFLLITTIKNILDKKINNFKLDIYGDGPLKEKLSEEIIKKKLNKFICLKKYTSNIHLILKNYHIGLSISSYDSFNRTLVEYMKSGLAVIASNSGNNPNLIINNKSGLLLKKFNQKELEKEICYLLKDKKRIIRIGKNAYKINKVKFLVSDSSLLIKRYLSL